MYDDDSNAVVACNLNGKSTDKTLVCLYEEINFKCVTCLFDLGFVLKFQCSFVIFHFHKETCNNI